MRNDILHRTNRRAGERGVTLLEVTLLLAALVIVSAAVAPAVLRSLNDANAKNVLQEMQGLHAAIMGDDAGNTYGYIGDNGRFPSYLDELVQQLDQPFFVRSELSGVGYGWNGPYVYEGRDVTDYRLDPWGNAYDIGVVGQGQLRSAGPNGIYDDEDDIVYPPYPVNPFGALVVVVKGHSGDAVYTDPEGCTVILRYSLSGEVDEVLDDLAPFSFEAVHRGLHEVEARCFDYSGNEVVEIGVAAVRGTGAQQVLDLHVELGEAPDTTRSGAEGTDTTSPDATSTSDSR